MTDHLEAFGDVLKDFGDIFAKLAQRPAALGAARLLWFMRLELARKVRRQRASRRLACSSRRRRWLLKGRCLLAAVGFQFFQLQLKLFDLPLDLLRAAPELHALQLGDEQRQMLDLMLMREQLLLN